MNTLLVLTVRDITEIKDLWKPVYEDGGAWIVPSSLRVIDPELPPEVGKEGIVLVSIFLLVDAPGAQAVDVAGGVGAGCPALWVPGDDVDEDTLLVQELHVATVICDEEIGLGDEVVVAWLQLGVGGNGIGVPEA